MTQPSKIPVQNLLGERLFEIKKLVSTIDRKLLDEKPHRHQWQELIYIQEGEGKYLIDDRVFTLKANTFYLIGAGQIHDFVHGTGLKGYLLRFKDNFLPPSGLNTQNSLNHSLLGRIIKSNELHIPKPQVLHYERVLEELYYEFSQNEQNYAKRAILQYLLLTLLTKLERRLRHISQDYIMLDTDHQSKIYHSFLMLIEDNYKLHHQISFYADELHMDKRKLTAISKKASGRKPKEILNYRLMTEAKRMLMYTTDTTKEIAYNLGFDDPAYFSRFFKLHTGLSPKTFKSANIHLRTQ